MTQRERALLRGWLPALLSVSGACFFGARIQAQEAQAAAGHASIATNALPSGPLGDCGDALSEAVGMDSAHRPCWADIRSNRPDVPSLNRDGIFGDRRNAVPAVERLPVFTYALGGVVGSNFAGGVNSQAYMEGSAVSFVLRRAGWRMMAEDAGVFGNYEMRGGDGPNLLGLNRAAIRASGAAAGRWRWQAGAANTYGNDPLRTFAPPDYRSFGGSQAPAPETAAYGLHAGNIAAQEEDALFRFAESRRTHWDFSAEHTLTQYADDGFSAQTFGGHAGSWHAVTPHAAFGFYGNAAHQTGRLACSLGGGGAQGLVQWGRRATVDVSGGPSVASSGCGKKLQMVGTMAADLHAGTRSDVYLAAGRDLGGGILEQPALLSKASAGLGYAVTAKAKIRLTGAALYGVDAFTHRSYHGSFSEVASSFRFGSRFSQEVSVRHYDVSGDMQTENRSLIVFTLWWAPTPEPKIPAHPEDQ